MGYEGGIMALDQSECLEMADVELMGRVREWMERMKMRLLNGESPLQAVIIFGKLGKEIAYHLDLGTPDAIESSSDDVQEIIAAEGHNYAIQIVQKRVPSFFVKDLSDFLKLCRGRRIAAFSRDWVDALIATGASYSCYFRLTQPFHGQAAHVVFEATLEESGPVMELKSSLFGRIWNR